MDIQCHKHKSQVDAQKLNGDDQVKEQLLPASQFYVRFIVDDDPSPSSSVPSHIPDTELEPAVIVGRKGCMRMMAEVCMYVGIGLGLLCSSLYTRLTLITSAFLYMPFIHRLLLLGWSDVFNSVQPFSSPFSLS